MSDGSALSLVLQPGGEGGTTRLGFARLVPGRRYRVRQSGAELTAGLDGTAGLDILLATRSEIDLVPVI